MPLLFILYITEHIASITCIVWHIYTIRYELYVYIKRVDLPMYTITLLRR